MKQVVFVRGEPEIMEVPAPKVEAGSVIVQVGFSCISTGTDIQGMKASSKSLWERAVSEPDKAVRFLKTSLTDGLAKTANVVADKLSSPIPIGYSAAGTVIAVGAGVRDIEVGDRVACAGSQGAYHAEQIKVSRNLTVKIPGPVDLADGCTVALGAIALQGIRRLAPTIGETVVVSGLGFLGLITVQILKACGCRVIAMDVQQERVDLASLVSADMVINPELENGFETVKAATQGYGADAVIITASSHSDQIVSAAFNMCRKKGRVILVGDVGLNLKRSDFYSKELDFLISSSYGPGRYDNAYEEKNVDYPLPYVRWTENRNMSQYLQLVAEKKVLIKPLVTNSYDISKAKEAYTALVNGRPRPLVALISYDARNSREANLIKNPDSKSRNLGAINVSVAGVGSFARGVHLPNLNLMKSRFQLRGVMNRSPLAARHVMDQYAGAFCTSDFEVLLDDKQCDAVLISTRHDSHLEMTLRALEKGKHVLVEKPLTLTPEGLGRIETFYSTEPHSVDDTTLPSTHPLLMVGYNRRFAPQVQKIKAMLDASGRPYIMNYTMNAGHVPEDNWIHGAEGGGRNLGEACHIYDLFNYLSGSQYEYVSTQALPSTRSTTTTDNFSVSIRYENKVVANLTYTSLGSGSFPKETLQIFLDGMVISLIDYERLLVDSDRRKETRGAQDKGHRAELEAFGDGLTKGYWPISLQEILLASKLSFEVENQLTRKPEC